VQVETLVSDRNNAIELRKFESSGKKYTERNATKQAHTTKATSGWSPVMTQPGNKVPSAASGLLTVKSQR